jgi:peptidyl-prolyl cis-trans isomerase D
LVLPQGFAKRVAEDIKENDRFVAGLENPRELVRWAYKADQDDVSPLFEVGNKYLFARVTKIKEKGTVPLEYIKSEVEAAVRKEKKAEQLIEKAKASMGSKSLDALASAVNSPVVPNVSLNFSFPVVPGISREAEVVGQVFGANKAEIIGPIKGERGVYVVRIDAFNEAVPLPDYTMNKFDASNTYKSRVDGEFLEGLKKTATLKDNRVLFY